MSEQIVIALVSGAFSLAVAYITATLKTRAEIKKWKLERAEDLRESNVDVLSNVSAWLCQTYNLHQKNKALEAVSSALARSSGEHAEILAHMYSELSVDHPNEQIIRTLTERYSTLKLRK